MNQLMETLFNALAGPGTGERTAPCAAAKEVIQAAKHRLTYEEFEQLWDAFFDLEKNDDLNSFVLGFRLGVQLTIEGLRPIALN